MKPLHVGVFLPNSKDATSFYRGAGPLWHLRRNYPMTFDLRSDGTYNWATFTEYDLLFFQRPATGEMLQLMKLAQKMNIPVWVDYDDYVFDIPTDNPAWKYYGRPEVREICIQSIKQANIVTVSTEKLKSLYEQMNPKITVVPNSYEPRILSDVPETPRKKKILWRGTDTHVRDLHTFAPAIIEVMKSNPEWTITFLGYHPWWIAEELKLQYTYQVAGNVLDYYRLLHEEAAAIVFVALSKHDFNESKSMIAWLEASVVGSAVLAPAFQEWRRPGCSHYTSVDGFKKSLQQMMSDFEQHPETLMKDVEASRKYIREEISLDVTNQIRWQLIKEATGFKECL